jgi:7,8-dihydropterin-6-yl-methyl-4-(beta-D-ribofuranosyl)aminobenzene 5'-phosphate synthase
LVRTDGGAILFDVGYDEGQIGDELPLEANMARLGIGLGDFDTLVISHNHPDHVGGYRFWKDGAFSLASISLDLSGKHIFVPEEMTYPGAQPVVSTEPALLKPGVFTTGALIFANPSPISVIKPVAHEQALVVNVAGQGLVLITGCGHPTIEKLVARVRALSDVPIVGVVGGLHYVGLSTDAIQPHIRFIQSLQPRLVALSPHDTDQNGLDAFSQAFPTVYKDIEVGREIVFGQ